VNGGTLHRVTTNGRDSFPAWSPDGKQIAFVRPIGPAWRIHLVAPSGGKPRRLAKAPAAGRPTWSSHGLMIPSDGDLLKIDPTNGHVLKYFGNTIDAVWGLNTVSLAPNLSSLTYIGAAAPELGDKECGDGTPCQRFALYRENVLAKGKAPRLLVKNVGPATYSPDGTRLAFVARNTKLQLWTLATGTSTSLSLGDNYASAAAAPAWQP
jgi:dipeptidyl aminopeptidase/acylaminoacyl peptidase